MVEAKKHSICIESKGCFGCQFYSSHVPCALPNGPSWQEVVVAWRNGGFAKGCPMVAVDQKVDDSSKELI